MMRSNRIHCCTGLILLHELPELLIEDTHARAGVAGTGNQDTPQFFRKARVQSLASDRLYVQAVPLQTSVRRLVALVHRDAYAVSLQPLRQTKAANASTRNDYVQFRSTHERLG
jgi:hypothetical protein